MSPQKRFLLASSCILGLAGCATPPEKTPTPIVSQNDVSMSEPSGNAHGPKIAYIVRNVNDPWIYREISQARVAARRDGARLLLFMAPDQGAIKAAMNSANIKTADGIILSSPRPEDRATIYPRGGNKDLKLLTIDDPISSKPAKPDLSLVVRNDYKSVGNMAVKAMLASVAQFRRKNREKWEFKSSGLIVFRGKYPGAIDAATDEEIKGITEAGLPKANVFILNIDPIDLPTARAAAEITIRKYASLFGNWLIGGVNDMAVVGGLRAAEEVNVGSQRVIGVGIGGDGALYDLQRPRRSTLVGSVLLPADVQGAQAEHQMFNWIVNKVKPSNYQPLPAVFLTRDNVRVLKSAYHIED